MLYRKKSSWGSLNAWFYPPLFSCGTSSCIFSVSSSKLLLSTKSFPLCHKQCQFSLIKKKKKGKNVFIFWGPWSPIAVTVSPFFSSHPVFWVISIHCLHLLSVLSPLNLLQPLFIPDHLLSLLLQEHWTHNCHSKWSIFSTNFVSFTELSLLFSSRFPSNSPKALSQSPFWPLLSLYVALQNVVTTQDSALDLLFLYVPLYFSSELHLFPCLNCHLYSDNAGMLSKPSSDFPRFKYLISKLQSQYAQILLVVF